MDGLVDPRRVIEIVRHDLGFHTDTYLSQTYVACVLSMMARQVSRRNRGGLIAAHFVLESGGGEPMLAIARRRRPHGRRLCEGEPLLRMASSASVGEGVQLWAARPDKLIEIVAELPRERGVLSDDHMRRMVRLVNGAMQQAAHSRNCG